MNNKTWIILMIVVFFTAMPALSQAVDLPETGQTTCYDGSGTLIGCANTGQDGDMLAGVSWPSSRFTDNTVTVTDNLTGLMWLQDANCMVTYYPGFDNDGIVEDGMVTWQNALDFVAGINAGTYSNCDGGYTDWRLPNINEIESLVNAEEADQATWLNSQGFTNAQSGGWYWSATTYVVDTSIAWRILMSYGHVEGGTKISSYFYIWPVRAATTTPAELWKTGQTTSYATGDDGDIQAGVAWPSPRFTTTYCEASGPCSDQGSDCDSNSSTDMVTDNLTGLIWARDANLNTGTDTWANALTYANDLMLCGYRDWRLPNRKELHSLTDFSQDTPALPSGYGSYFTNVQSTRYWSATTHMYDKGDAWRLSMDSGRVVTTIKTDSWYIWPVRGVPHISVTDSLGTNDDLRVSFGEADVGISSSGTVTVTNNGATTLTGVSTSAEIYNTEFLPFTITSDTCSTAGSLSAGANCTIGISLSRASAGAWGKIIRIYSNEDPEIIVSMCGSTTGESTPWFASTADDDDLMGPMSTSCLGPEGNHPPPAPELVSPADGQTGLGTTVEFVWEKCIDPNGDPVTYDLSYCEGAPQEDCITRELASLTERNNRTSYAGIGYGAGILLFGIALASGVSRRKQIALLIGIIFLSGMFLVSCGSGSGGGSSNLVSYEVEGLNPGATYYWKVTAKDDKGAGSGSQTRSFTTQ